MGYNWSNKKLLDMFKKPESRKDLRNLLMHNFDFLGISDGLKKKPEQIINEDQKILDSMPSLSNYIYEFDKTGLEYFKNQRECPNIFSEEDALSTVNAYYAQLPGDIYGVFKHLYNNRNSNLKFVKNSRELGSKTIICPSNGEIYMFVNFDGSVNGFTNLVHEYAHAIGFSLYPYDLRKDNDFLFGEVESIFHTLLSLDFLEKELGINEEINKERKLIINDTINDTNIIGQKKLILSAASEANGLSIKGFKEYLKTFYSIPENEIETCLSKPADMIIPYLIGEYTAFELYKIYEEEPEYAMFLYETITRISADNPEDYFRQIENLGIHLGTSVESYARKLKA